MPSRESDSVTASCTRFAAADSVPPEDSVKPSRSSPCNSRCDTPDFFVLSHMRCALPKIRDNQGGTARLATR